MTMIEGTTTSPSHVDEEGLQRHYDVILCGTGLISSILAAALARQGKSCLHLDSQDTYGGLEAIWNHETLQRLQQQQQQQQQQRSSSTDSASTSCTAAGSSLCPVPDVPLAEHGEMTSLEFHSISHPASTISLLSMFTLVQTPWGNGRITSMDASTLQVTLDPGGEDRSAAVEGAASDNNNKYAIAAGVLEFPIPVPLDDPASSLEAFVKVHYGIVPRLPTLLQRISWDSSSSLPIFAQGPAVSTLLQSHVAEYMEFQSVEGILLPSDKGGWNTRSDASQLQQQQQQQWMVRVPCSKHDVFASTLLSSPLEKRKLMKVLQLVMDYGIATMNVPASAAVDTRADTEQQQGDAHSDVVAANTTKNEDTEDRHPETVVQSLNERYLNQGRSLARPQNKMVATLELERLQATLSEQQQLSLQDYLCKHQGLSPKLTAIVRFALALDTTHSSSTSVGVGLAKGIETLILHLQSLGKYGTTALLMPLYGSGELSQAFCRSAAVFGATYLLRRKTIGINTITTVSADGTPATTNSTSPSPLAVVVEGATQDFPMPLLTTETQSRPSSPPVSSHKSITCSHLVVPRTALQTFATSTYTKRIVRRMSLIENALVPMDTRISTKGTLQQHQRHLMIFPPQTLVGQDQVIYGMTADESIHVVPSGFTLLYLTTTVLTSNGGNDTTSDEAISTAVKLLDQVAELLRSSSSSSTTTEKANEIYHTTFSYIVFDDDHNHDETKDEEVYPPQTETRRADDFPSNLHFCPSLGATMTADVAFVRAQKLFEAIMYSESGGGSGVSFMGLSSTFQRVLEERDAASSQGGLHDSEDDEQAMLSSALGMLTAHRQEDTVREDCNAKCITSTASSMATGDNSTTPTSIPATIVDAS
jgi:RAB protein geranylgeranyltransferase component A